VVHGRASPALLDSYEAERLPVARRLLETTDRAFRVVVADNPLAGVMRTKVLARMAAFAMARPAVQRVAFRTVSQTGIHYRNGPLAIVDGVPPSDAPRAGDRFPWLRVALGGDDGGVTDLYERTDDTRWTLVLAGLDAAGVEAAWPGGLDTIVIPAGAANDAELARAGIPRPSYYLLRPDGHVGLCGTRLDLATVRRYAAETLTLRVSPP
jgi:hypothetical protein